MSKRPLSLLFASLLFLYLPLEFFWHWKLGASPSTAEFVVSVVLPFLLLAGLLHVTRVGWYTMIGLVTLWGTQDLYDFYASEGSPSQLLTHLVIYAFSVGYFINPRVRHLYFDPKARWWKTKRRYETQLPFLMKHGDLWHYPLLRNVSEGGCFIETPHLLDLNEKISVSIPLPVPLGVSLIQTEGEVRWVSRNPLRHGMGVQFLQPERLQEKALREYVRLQL